METPHSNHTPEAQPPIDEARVEAFAGQVVGDLAATMTTTFCALGDRLGLFRALAAGPATSEEIAERAGAQPRYVEEWARGLTTAGYLEHDAATGRFSLPAEHAAVLADEGGPAFAAGAHQFAWGMLAVFEELAGAFLRGGGVSLDRYGADFWEGMERLTSVTFEHTLVQSWLPAVEGLEQRLEQGARVADIGCGAGTAAIRIGQAFPRTTVVGVDVHEPNVERAREAARKAGVDDRVTFERADGVEGLSGTYDLVTIFNVVHDTVDPVQFMRMARSVLADDGVCLVQELNCHESLDDEQGPVGSLLYGISLMHCLTQSIADGGAALGTCGLPEPRLREVCRQAGFGSLERLAEEPLDVLYLARP